MCGIAGIIDLTDSRPAEDTLRRMLGLIRHRGPDAAGAYFDETVALGSVRLRILDLFGGDQPIHNEDESIWVVYNGEVFNYIELKPDLEARGHRFYTNTDTEVLIHLYEEKGMEMLSDLNSQFAFALWDRKKETVFLARDRIGIRPLFYWVRNKHLLFGSEIKCLLADSRVSGELDLSTLSDIFTCWTPVGDLTAFKNIRQLLPGNYAIFSKEGMSIHRYWQHSFAEPEDRSRDLDEWTGELKWLLHDACRIRLRADVPVGAYLSGGLDSTYISSLVKKYFDNKVCTFSVGFTDGRFDEGLFQQRAVQTLGTDHRMVRCTERDIWEVFPDVIWHTESPLLRTAPAPLFLLSRLVRDNTYKVVLTGEGSDELFAGYDIFKEDRVRRFWARQPDSVFRPKLLQRLYPDIFRQSDTRARIFLEGFFRKGLSRIDLPGYSHMIRWDNTSLLRGFLSADAQHQIADLDSFQVRYCASLPSDFMNWHPLSRAQYTESTLFLSNYLLSSQGDRMAMAHAVEGRYPFLDYRVIEFASRVPPTYRLYGLKDKYIVRNAASDLIPPELAQRPKQPYRAPISRCFFGENPFPYVEELLSEKCLKEKGYFHPGKVTKLVEKIRRQEGHLLSERENMGLIGILSTQLLDEMFIKEFPFHAVVEPENIKVYDYRSR